MIIISLPCHQAVKKVSARRIIGVDLNDNKFELAKSLGVIECCNGGGDVKSVLMGKEKWGYDYTFHCTGNLHVRRNALEVHFISIDH